MTRLESYPVEHASDHVTTKLSDLHISDISKVPYNRIVFTGWGSQIPDYLIYDDFGGCLMDCDGADSDCSCPPQAMVCTSGMLDVWGVDPMELAIMPDGFLPPWAPYDPEGCVYMIATVPELSLNRVKIGHSTKIDGRLKTYRVANPTLMVLGIWAGSVQLESEIHDFVKGCRIGDSECFDLWDPFKTLIDLDKRFRPKVST